MAKHNECQWNLEKLKQDIAKYTEMRDNLVSTVKKMEQAKQSADETLRNVENEDNIWKERCLQQQEENKRLQADLEGHQNDMKRMRAKSGDDVPGQSLEPSRSRLNNMSDLALRHLQKKLEKDKTELEWKLKEYGWRLDQASAALCRAKEERESISTQIKAAVIKLKDTQKSDDHEEVTKSESINHQ